MGRPIELEDVVAEMEEFGALATLVSVTAEGAPHLGTVLVTPTDSYLTVRVGERTAGHVRGNSSVTLAWLREGSDYQLIVDGTGSVAAQPGDDGLFSVEVSVERGILHRVAGPADGPTCLPLGRRPTGAPTS